VGETKIRHSSSGFNSSIFNLSQRRITVELNPKFEARKSKQIRMTEIQNSKRDDPIP
jgi:hypothetical protein